uniref:Uncharacterized protein n=1 Tax=Romanomermis culicivorax TaxID=13658 RepID=A0A915HYD5_ROMCU
MFLGKGKLFCHTF